MMDGTAVNAMLSEARKATALQVVPIEVPPGCEFVVAHSNDVTIEHFDEPIKFRNHRPQSVRALVELVEFMYPKLDPGDASGETEEITLWYHGDGVEAIFDDGLGRREQRAYLALPKTPEWKLLENLSDQRGPMTQKQILKLLRIDLAGCGIPADLISMLRRIDMKASKEGSSELRHGSESLDSRVVTSVTGAGDLPETIYVLPSIFQVPGLDETVQVPCLLELEAASATFTLIPSPSEMRKLKETLLNKLGEQLREDLKGLKLVKIFQGTPGPE